MPWFLYTQIISAPMISQVSLSVSSYFFEPNQFLSLDLSQKAKKESKHLLGKTFVPHPNMSSPVTLTVTPVPVYGTRLFFRLLDSVFSLVWFAPLNHDGCVVPFPL